MNMFNHIHITERQQLLAKLEGEVVEAAIATRHARQDMLSCSFEGGLEVQRKYNEAMRMELVAVDALLAARRRRSDGNEA